MSRSKAITFVTVSLMVGVIIGLVITSNFDMMQQSNASEKEAAIATVRMEPEAAYMADGESAGQIGLDDLERTSRTYVQVVKQVSKTVVMITSKKKVKVQNPLSQFFGDDFFRHFYGRDFQNQQEPQEQERMALGSGVIVSADGYILTNNHVVSDADELLVNIDNEEVDAEIVGTDPKSDLAVIRVKKKNLPYIRQGNSDKLEVGEIVLAIGSPFSDRLQNTVTQGIVSGKGRRGLSIGDASGRSTLDNQDFIQTDAAINPGNSGGALVNLRGELVGINTAIIGQANVGIGFAIPINLAKWVMEQIIDQGHVTRGYLGVEIRSLDKKMAKAFGLKDTRGALVNSVSPGYPAEKAGMEDGDVIVEIDGRAIEDHLELMNVIAQYAPGSKINIKVMRKGKEKMLRVELTARPDEEKIAQIKPSKTSEAAGQLGIQVEELTGDLKKQLGYEEDYGVVVSSVERTSPAFNQGLRKGDLILEYGVEKVKIKNPDQFYDLLKKANPGDVLLFRVRNSRGASFLTFEVPEEE